VDVRARLSRDGDLAERDGRQRHQRRRPLKERKTHAKGRPRVPRRGGRPRQGLALQLPVRGRGRARPRVQGARVARLQHPLLGGRQAEELSDEDVAGMRKRWASMGMANEETTDEQIRNLVGEMGRRFRDDAPTTAEQAASIILDGVREERWRILIGKDAHRLDELVREDPESAYTPEFMVRLRETGEWGLG